MCVSEFTNNCSGPSENIKLPCPHTNKTTGSSLTQSHTVPLTLFACVDVAGVTKQFCCRGYAIDLLVKLQESLEVTVDIHLVGDGRYGSYDFVSFCAVHVETVTQWNVIACSTRTPRAVARGTDWWES